LFWRPNVLTAVLAFYLDPV